MANKQTLCRFAMNTFDLSSIDADRCHMYSINGLRSQCPTIQSPKGNGIWTPFDRKFEDATVISRG